MYTINDVGKKVVNGIEKEYTDDEKQLIVDEWRKEYDIASVVKVRKAVIERGKSRIQQAVPEWDDENLKFLLSFANLLDLTRLNASQDLAKDIYLFAKSTISGLKDLTQDQLNNFDVDTLNWPT